MSDKHTKEQRSANMRAIKSKDTKIELVLRRALWKKGLRYRKNDRSVYGKPDIVFKGKRIAVFCDSEFWHGKDWHIAKNRIKSNTEFWHSKIERNIERDKKVNEQLKKDGWIVLRFWGDQIRLNLDECVDQIHKAFNARS